MFIHQPEMGLPAIALSVRQPWAWALVTGHKDIENRSTFAVSKAGFDPCPVAIHAAQGMTKAEYEYAAEFMESLGVQCPHPAGLVRGAIIGAATVTAVVKEHDSPWFFGPRGLVMAGAYEVAPIPAVGALGYFNWRHSGGAAAVTLPWMQVWPGDIRPINKVKTVKQVAAAPLFD